MMIKFPEEMLKLSGSVLVGEAGSCCFLSVSPRTGTLLFHLGSPILMASGMGQSLECWLPAFWGPDRLGK